MGLNVAWLLMPDGRMVFLGKGLDWSSFSQTTASNILTVKKKKTAKQSCEWKHLLKGSLQSHNRFAILKRISTSNQAQFIPIKHSLRNTACPSIVRIEHRVTKQILYQIVFMNMTMSSLYFSGVCSHQIWIQQNRERGWTGKWEPEYPAYISSEMLNSHVKKQRKVFNKWNPCREEIRLFDSNGDEKCIVQNICDGNVPI